MFDADYKWTVLPLCIGVNKRVVMMLICYQGLKEFELTSTWRSICREITQTVTSKPHLELYAWIISAKNWLYAKFQLPVHTANVTNKLMCIVTILVCSFVLLNFLGNSMTCWKNVSGISRCVPTLTNQKQWQPDFTQFVSIFIFEAVRC